MGLEQLQPGLVYRDTLPITDILTVPAMAPLYHSEVEMPPVFATAHMIGFIEWTCIAALRPYLLPHQRTVGILVDIRHTAATPTGMTVTAEVELIDIRDRQLRFRVSCRDDVEEIGGGFHERAVIDNDRFLNRVLNKGGSLTA